MLCNEKKIGICPAAPKIINKENIHYTELMAGEIHSLINQGYNLLCDDRFITSYNNIIGKRGKTHAIICTLDVLYCLYIKNKLSEIRLYQHLDALLAAKYSYFVPDAAYIYHCLTLADLDDEGRLSEITQLKIIRRSIATALQTQNGLVIEKLAHTEISEQAGYIMTIQRTFEACMSKVWRSEKNLTWKQESSNWLLMSLADFFCDIYMPNYDFKKWMIMKQKILIIYGIALSDVPLVQSEYIRWIFSYLSISWSHDPSIKMDVAIALSEFILHNDVEKNVPINTTLRHWEQYIYCFFGKFLNILPKYFLYYVLEQPGMTKYKNLIVSSIPLLEQTTTTHVSSVGACKFNLEKILYGDEDTLEYALNLICEQPEENGLLILEKLSESNLNKVDISMRYRLARFLSDLAWYLPPLLYIQAQEKKRFLGLLKS